MTSPYRIVAEVSRNPRHGDNDASLSQRFQEVIDVNADRGYELESWQFEHSMCAQGPVAQVLIETIVAVFRRIEVSA